MVSLSKNVLITLAASLFAQAHVLPLVPRAGGGLKLDFTVRTELKNASTPITDESGVSKASKEVVASLKNYQVYYGIDIGLGSNDQKIQVDIDTGSADLWVNSANVKCNVQGGGCTDNGSYDPSTSSTSQNLNEAFSIGYVDGTSTSGTFYKDEITLGGTTVKNMQFAVADTTSVSQGGVFGIGYESLESTSQTYVNFPALLKQQGIISSNYYSLYLDSPTSSTGSLIFGGIDDTKYSGSLVDLPFQSEQRFSVTLNSISSGSTSIGVNTEVVLDSGSTICSLPQDTVDQIAQLTNNPQYDPWAEQYIVDCTAPSGNLDFQFNGVKISVPWNTLITQAQSNVGTVCTLDLMYGSEDAMILGDNFLRSAYVVFDLDEKKARIAQAKY